MIESVRVYVYGAFCVHYDLVGFCYSAVIISAVAAVLRAHPLCACACSMLAGLGLLEAGWGKGTLHKYKSSKRYFIYLLLPILSLEVLYATQGILYMYPYHYSTRTSTIFQDCMLWAGGVCVSSPDWSFEAHLSICVAA
jgi:hypothetical protein